MPNKSIQLAVILKTNGTLVRLAKIPLNAGPMMAAIPTKAPEIALPFPLFSCSVALAKNVKAAGTIKPATNP